MRGSRASRDGFCEAARIIPAHAGLTSPSCHQVFSSRDHPRACGAHCSFVSFCGLIRGSSPRMRGSQTCFHRENDEDGIIPAHAGLTGDCIEARRHEWNHPRACGAHQYRRYQGCHGLGIIPAHAGLTRGQPRRSCCRRDHPRACGAHNSLILHQDFDAGSSPRMRGSRESIRAATSGDGIIPAHAGLTSTDDLISLHVWDHPRACGAHSVLALYHALPTGSSPRMRGSLLNLRDNRAGYGIIPAHAGLTELERRATRTTRDHPRACGAHISGMICPEMRGGSSPRMRGSQVVQALHC